MQSVTEPSSTPVRAQASPFDAFSRDGFVVVPSVLDARHCDVVASELTPGDGRSVGSRRLLAHRWCRDLAGRLRDHSALSTLVPATWVAMQCTSFEKSLANNWLVALHQDVGIPVAERVRHPALRGWSEKQGVAFVQPPVSVLEQLVAVRLHLDDCADEDGPLRVVPGSHRLGRIDPARSMAASVRCAAGQGDAVLMRPLLLHGSSKSTGTSRRRVLHFVYGPPALPHGLRWRDAV